MADFLPQADPDFNTFTANFVGYVNSHLAEFGLVAADLAPLVAALSAWTTAIAALGPAVAAAAAATQAKVSAHDALEALVRALVAVIQAKGAAVTDTSKTAAGVPVVDTIRTPIPPPVTAPIGRVEVTGVRKHTIHFVDETTPTSKAKPAGVRGAEIWLKIGMTPPASQDEMDYITTDTRTPYTYDFEPADAGKTAYYWLRWVNSKGDPGPWSAMVSATITG